MAGRVIIEPQADRALAILELSNPDRQNAISASIWDSLGKFVKAAGARFAAPARACAKPDGKGSPERTARGTSRTVRWRKLKRHSWRVKWN